MNTTDSLRGYRQLSDPNFYQLKTEDETHLYSQRIAEILLQTRSLNLITEKNIEYLNINKPKEATFYLLPTMHKKNIPGRPICSSINHPTSKISKFVDKHIKNMYLE